MAYRTYPLTHLSYRCLKDVSTSMGPRSALIGLFHETLAMHLHVDLLAVKRFVGTHGEEEARNAYHSLLQWSATKQARVAVWHAGQTLRMAQDVPPYQLRGADAILISHAAMVLWTYSLMLNDAARRTGATTPREGFNQRDTSSSRPSSRPIDGVEAGDSRVILNGASNEQTEKYIHRGHGRPCLQMLKEIPLATAGRDRGICDLRDSAAVMKIAKAVLQGNCPRDTHDAMPQMIKCLCDLMQELGTLK